MKKRLQKATESDRIETYKTKEQQSEVYHEWLNQKLHGQKTSSIMIILEHMVEAWKVARGLAQENKC